MRLLEKIAVVTGAASGFGAGIARRFVAEGARVILADLNGEGAQTLADELGDAALAHQLDVTDRAEVTGLATAVEAQFGPLDIFVNNAGVTHLPTPLETVSETDFDRVFAVNCKSIYLASQVFIPAMKLRKCGVFLNVSSTAGLSPRPNLSWYNASKGWVNTATETMSIELAPFGIRVNALNPVAGETPLLKSFMGEDTPEIRAKFLSTIPLGRFSTPEDMANAALYLCSDEASMITGVCLRVDGGRCI